MQKKVGATPCMFILCSCSSLQTRTRGASESNNAVLAAMNQHRRKKGRKKIDIMELVNYSTLTAAPSNSMRRFFSE